MSDIKFEIVEHIGVIGESNTGWRRELNLVRWNEGNVKYDIRSWDESHEHMSRGVTFTYNEIDELYTLLECYKNDNNGNFKVNCE